MNDHVDRHRLKSETKKITKDMEELKRKLMNLEGMINAKSNSIFTLRRSKGKLEVTQG